jgi:hypothetical protein
VIDVWLVLLTYVPTEGKVVVLKVKPQDSLEWLQVSGPLLLLNESLGCDLKSAF